MVMVVSGERLIIEWRFMNPKRMPLELSYEIAFLGACMGVALSRVGVGRHYAAVQFHIVVESEGQWHVKQGLGMSAFWLHDLREQISAALEWLENNATRTPHGWEFN